MSSHRANDSAVGTATHTTHYWTSKRVDAWLRGFYAREGAQRIELLVKPAIEAFVAEHFATIYCPVCGEQIVRQGETRAQWGSRRRCDACLADNRRAGDVKFCRSCRTPMPRSGTPDVKAWATLATCETCKAFNRTLVARASEVARAIRAEVGEMVRADYVASLSPKLQRRLNKRTS